MPFDIFYNFRPQEEIWVITNNAVKHGTVQQVEFDVYPTLTGVEERLLYLVLLDEVGAGTIRLTEDLIFAELTDATYALSLLLGASPTPTPTLTPTPTVTTTNTPTPTVTASITPTPSVTMTVTPSLTATTTPTPTLTASVTPTPSVTMTITPTVTLTPTPTITPSQSYVPNTLGQGLLNFWPLDEASGSRSNTERFLPLVETSGSVGVATGLRGTGDAAELTYAATSYLYSPQTSYGLLGTPFTKSLWVYIVTAPVRGADPDGYHEVYGCRSIGTPLNRESLVFINEGPTTSDIDVSMRSTVSAENIVDPAGENLDWSTTEGQWNHLVWGHDGTNMFYQRNNGTRISQADATAIPAASVDARFSLGDAIYGQAYNPNAAFQYLAHWNRALSEEEVTQLYNNGQGLTRDEMLGSSFNPYNLFQPGDTGAWYDPQQLGTLFQNSNGTTAVTTDTNPVGYIGDISGFGNHATQATAGFRGVLSTRENKKIIQLDFIDDSYNWSFNGVTGTYAFASPYGAQVFTLDAFSYVPRIQFTEMFFIDRILTTEESAALLSYMEGKCPTVLHSGEVSGTTIGFGMTSAFYDNPTQSLSLDIVGGPSTSGPPFGSPGTFYNHLTGLTDRAMFDLTAIIPNEIITSGGLLPGYGYMYAAITTVPPIIVGGAPNLENVVIKASRALQGTVNIDAMPASIKYIESQHAVGDYGVLEGRMPDFSRFTDLIILNIGLNNLTGGMPDVSSNILLSSFGISNNPLGGTIPSLSANVNLQYLYIHNCELTGNLPDLSNNTILKTVSAYNNLLTGYDGGTVSNLLGALQLQNNLLTQSAVNAILAAFVAANKTTGTRLLNLGGTGNAAPSGQGLTDKATLQSRGWTVTTN